MTLHHKPQRNNGVAVITVTSNTFILHEWLQTNKEQSVFDVTYICLNTHRGESEKQGSIIFDAEPYIRLRNANDFTAVITFSPSRHR